MALARLWVFPFNIRLSYKKVTCPRPKHLRTRRLDIQQQLAQHCISTNTCHKLADLSLLPLLCQQCHASSLLPAGRRHATPCSLEVSS
ncbi:hypothetical protein QQF64_030774 [Cirrhinus molitorella]|uniref:Uncharacterized protein n=1 Tax=Cirrhinus molitorella TaxID=172907 RepID=A0ABR3N495_9TELE